ncbi:hypothetical protein O0L34_g2475 [Tuta absoluta]|nr:hypothetical protein O0L34_g2475 [Tuta absoluta]
MSVARPRRAPLLLALAAALLPQVNHVAGAGGGGMFGDVNISAILDSFSISYDKRVRPNYGGPPVEVGVTMYVLSISSLSEVKMVSFKAILKKTQRIHSKILVP